MAGQFPRRIDDFPFPIGGGEFHEQNAPVRGRLHQSGELPGQGFLNHGTQALGIGGPIIPNRNRPHPGFPFPDLHVHPHTASLAGRQADGYCQVKRAIAAGRESRQRIHRPGEQGAADQIAMPGEGFVQEIRVEAQTKAPVRQIEPCFSLECLDNRLSRFSWWFSKAETRTWIGGDSLSSMRARPFKPPNLCEGQTGTEGDRFLFTPLPGVPRSLPQRALWRRAAFSVVGRLCFRNRSAKASSDSF